MWSRSGRFAAAVVVAVLAMSVAARPALAIVQRGGDAPSIGASETVDDDVLLAGQAVRIDGRVTGDVYAFGQSVTVNGTIDGDLIGAAQQVVVVGSVGGNVRAAGAQLDVRGSVGKNVTLAGANISVAGPAKVGGSALIGAATVEVGGQVGRGLTVGASQLDIAGQVGGPVLASVETLTLQPTARLASSLAYQAERQATIASGQVSGPVSFAPRPPSQSGTAQPQQEPLGGMLSPWSIIPLLGTMLIAVAMILWAPRMSRAVAASAGSRPLMVAVAGLALLATVPVAIVMLLVTLVGAPIAVILGLTYGLGLALAWPTLGVGVGAVCGPLVRQDPNRRLVWLAIAALVVLHILTYVPILGGLVVFAGLVFGLGLVAMAVWSLVTTPPSAMYA
jgi:cytoskeletal protein CcmA (bactofilin family)